MTQTTLLKSIKIKVEQTGANYFKLTLNNIFSDEQATTIEDIHREELEEIQEFLNEVLKK